MITSTVQDRLYEFLSDDEDARVCTDISDAACEVVPGNALKQLVVSVLTKTGDALSKPGLILTWLLTVLGAPAAAIGLLVPVREAGSLLPQMMVGGVIRRFPIRKGFWVAGGVLQGLAVLGMGAVAMTLEGAAAGWTVVGLVVVLSLARGICSIASKDLMGKTIPKTRRGRLAGLATSISGVVALVAGLFFATYRKEDLPVTVFAAILAVAGGLWLVAAVVMSLLDELPGATSGGGNALKSALGSLRLLVDDRSFRRFCLARALLAGTVLSMPYYVMLAHRATEGRIASLGTLMVCGSVATALSATVWGRMADRSSRKTLVVAGVSAGVIGCLTAGAAGLEVSSAAALWMYGGLFFLIGLAHTGIRLGRKTYLVDMATAENRASYVAVSNTLIGVVLLAGGSFGLLAEAIGARGVILAFAILGIAGGSLALSLPEVQDP